MIEYIKKCLKLSNFYVSLFKEKQTKQDKEDMIKSFNYIKDTFLKLTSKTYPYGFEDIVIKDIPIFLRQHGKLLKGIDVVTGETKWEVESSIPSDFIELPFGYLIYHGYILDTKDGTLTIL